MAFLGASTEFQMQCSSLQDEAIKCTKYQQANEAEIQLVQTQLISIRMHVQEREDELSTCDQALLALTSEMQGGHSYHVDSSAC